MKLSRISAVVALSLLALQSLALGLAYDGIAMAQNDPPKPADGGGLDIDVDINTKDDSAIWYGQWWIWAIGVGVFLVVIVALTNRGGKAA